MLIVLSGFPGVGKTAIARELARVLPAVHVRVDSIDQALRRAGLQCGEPNTKSNQSSRAAGRQSCR